MHPSLSANAVLTVFIFCCSWSVFLTARLRNLCSFLSFHLRHQCSQRKMYPFQSSLELFSQQKEKLVCWCVANSKAFIIQKMPSDRYKNTTFIVSALATLPVLYVGISSKNERMGKKKPSTKFLRLIFRNYTQIISLFCFMTTEICPSSIRN